MPDVVFGLASNRRTLSVSAWAFVDTGVTAWLGMFRSFHVQVDGVRSTVYRLAFWLMRTALHHSITSSSSSGCHHSMLNTCIVIDSTPTTCPGQPCRSKDRGQSSASTMKHALHIA